MSDKLFKPGQKAPRSGQYEITGPRGGRTGVERTVTRNEPLPPPEEKGQNTALLIRQSIAASVNANMRGTAKFEPRMADELCYDEL